MTSNAAAARRGGTAAYYIKEECERLFCETLRAVFLVEGFGSSEDSLVMDMHSSSHIDHRLDSLRRDSSVSNTSTSTSSLISSNMHDDVGSVSAVAQSNLAPDGFAEGSGLVLYWLEVFDYVGGARFRCFISQKTEHEQAMFVFFDKNTIVETEELKPGLMALLELCAVPALNCSELILCLDKIAPEKSRSNLIHDLGWVGFEPATLADWTKSDDIISSRWMFLGMET
jgi:hypothetical protein